MQMTTQIFCILCNILLVDTQKCPFPQSITCGNESSNPTNVSFSPVVNIYFSVHHHVGRKNVSERALKGIGVKIGLVLYMTPSSLHHKI